MPHYGTFEENNKLSMAQLQAALGDQVRSSTQAVSNPVAFYVQLPVCEINLFTFVRENIIKMYAAGQKPANNLIFDIDALSRNLRQSNTSMAGGHRG